MKFQGLKHTGARKLHFIGLELVVALGLTLTLGLRHGSVAQASGPGGALPTLQGEAALTYLKEQVREVRQTDSQPPGASWVQNPANRRRPGFRPESTSVVATGARAQAQIVVNTLDDELNNDGDSTLFDNGAQHNHSHSLFGDGSIQLRNSIVDPFWGVELL